MTTRREVKIRLAPKTIEQLDRVAQLERRTRAAQVEYFVEQAIRRMEREQPAK